MKKLIDSFPSSLNAHLTVGILGGQQLTNDVKAGGALPLMTNTPYIPTPY
jgi:hypothetical protein